MLITKSEIRLINEKFIWTGENKRDLMEHIASLETLIPAALLSAAVAGDSPARELREIEREAKRQEEEKKRFAHV